LKIPPYWRLRNLVNDEAFVTPLARSSFHGQISVVAAAREAWQQELQIALHVARGATNREVAGALFLSVKTIEAHLHATYSKLGLRRRAELAALVASARDVSVDPVSDLG
jgi:DNA-binding NarL/FixJ family response regulator